MYQHTTADQFRRLISDECVNVAKEEMVLDSVLEWVRYDVENRQRHLPEMLEAVQWPLVRNRDTIQYNIIQFEEPLRTSLGLDLRVKIKLKLGNLESLPYRWITGHLNMTEVKTSRVSHLTQD